MGCSNAREKLENQMMNMQMKRLEIQMEKYNQMQELSKIEKKKVRPSFIPDYIDPKFAQSHYIYIDKDSDKKTDFTKEKKPIKIKKRLSSRKSKINLKQLN